MKKSYISIQSVDFEKEYLMHTARYVIERDFAGIKNIIGIVLCVGALALINFL